MRKATSGAVMAMKRGSKTVASGLEVGQRTGEAIAGLAQGMEESSDAALQIASTG